MRLAHFALDLGTGHQRRHRIQHHNIHGAGTDQRLHDLQRLLTGVRLGHQQGVHIHPQRPGIYRVQSVLHVDIRRFAAFFLRLRHHMECQRGLTGCLGPVDLHDPPPGQTADAQRRIQ